jgi:hypothetical protein
MREIEICGPGDGILLVNRLPQGNKAIDGSFFTATTIWGGHIYVKGRALVIGNNVWNTKLFGTFIDITKGGGIFMEKDAWDLCLVGVTLDLSMKKRRWTGAEKIIVHSYRAAKSINHSATNLEKDEIIIKKQ